ncbi:type IV pilin protein [Kineococcus auxinigenes]|uniref:type IV pilin protein n=1 Tax=unclassified Kineococcus TaxID=2621656 RepID=UPI003D7DA898
MLARIRKSMENKDQGFTLIELLVVMIIIGILAAIAIPVFLNQRKKAVDSSIKSDLKTIATAMETSFTDAQVYPTVAVSGTTATLTQAAGTGTTASTETVKISTGNTFTVTSTNSGNGYCIVGSRINGASAASQNWVYNSDAGGLQPASVKTCTTTTTP